MSDGTIDCMGNFTTAKNFSLALDSYATRAARFASGACKEDDFGVMAYEFRARAVAYGTALGLSRDDVLAELDYIRKINDIK